jgi:hypothetical protein
VYNGRIQDWATNKFIMEETSMVSKGILKLILPSAVGLTVYYITGKVVGKDNAKEYEIEVTRDFGETFRGGDIITPKNFWKSFGNYIKKNPQLKLMLITGLFTAIATNFNEEAISLLSNKALKTLHRDYRLKGSMKLISKMVRKYELHGYSEALSELIMSNKFTASDKIELLKIKLKFILTGSFPGKTQALVSIATAFIIVPFCSAKNLFPIFFFIYGLFELTDEGTLQRALAPDLRASLLSKITSIPGDPSLMIEPFLPQIGPNGHEIVLKAVPKIAEGLIHLFPNVTGGLIEDFPQITGLLENISNTKPDL